MERSVHIAQILLQHGVSASAKQVDGLMPTMLALQQVCFIANIAIETNVA